jgi:hypothetical protein
VGVLKWMKDPISVQFRGTEAVRNSRGLITVCGEVNGRNSAGNIGVSPFVGVPMRPGADADFALAWFSTRSGPRPPPAVTRLWRKCGLGGEVHLRQSGEACDLCKRDALVVVVPTSNRMEHG